MMDTRFMPMFSLLLILVLGGAVLMVVVLLAKAVGKRGALGLLLGFMAVLGILAVLLVGVRTSRTVEVYDTVTTGRNSFPANAPAGTVAPQIDVTETEDGVTSVPQASVSATAPKSRNAVRATVRPAGPEASASATAEKWTPSDRHAFEASVYPSASSAVVGLSRAILKKQLGDVMPAAIPLKQLLVSGNADRALQTSLLRDLRSALPSYCPDELKQMEEDARVRYGLDASDKRGAMFESLRKGQSGRSDIQFFSPAASQPETTALDPWQAQLLIDISKDQADGSSSGQVKVTLRGSAAEATYSADYVDAEWAEDFNKWVKQSPGHQWILSTSEQLCVSEAEAEKQALEAAVSELQRRLDEFVSDPQRGYAEFRGRRDPAWVRQQLAIALRDGGFTHKTFSQRFQRPYGDVYRAAVLVDASPARLEGVASKYWQHAKVVRQRDLGIVASSLGLILVICVVYLFLNAATRGYYVWSMRAAAVVLVFAGLVTLTHFM
jgi:hypothetical protein